MKLLAVAMGLITIWSQAAAATEPAIDYVRDVKPLLMKRCYACHGAGKQQSGLRLDTVTAMRKGGKQGAAIIPGKPDDSLLIEAVTGAADWRMPPADSGDKLPERDVALLRAWIAQGAPHTTDESPQPDPRSHWSFRAPVRPAIPAAIANYPAGNAIDVFLVEEQRRLKLKPCAPAPRHVLLRRVHLDLIGLPPTPEEIRAFEADHAPDAYERVVDQLLASPRFGERWGRHWMDVWRYSDWYGYGNEIRNSQYHIWRWRDWIIESVNGDKSYDRMIVEMIAGDELSPADPQVLRATGYLARSWYKFNRNVWLDATVEHTAKAFLALTMNCARCHEHKYDPIEQQDYYRFRAFFEPHQVRTDRRPGQSDLQKDGLARVYDTEAAPTYLFLRGNEKQPDKSRTLKPGTPNVLGGQPFVIRPVSLPLGAYYQGVHSFVREELVQKANAEAASARTAQGEAEKALAEAQKQKADAAALQTLLGAVRVSGVRRLAAEAELTAVQARVAADAARYGGSPDPARPAGPPADNAKTLARFAAQSERLANTLAAQLAVAAAEQKLTDAQSGPDKSKSQPKIAEAKKNYEDAQAKLKTEFDALAKNDDAYTPLTPVYPATSTGRRLALARWIADRSNPLTARVAVNHIWMRHIGQPLVPTVFDFGMNGKPPTHPKLIDWLAVELMENNWSHKHIHHLIVTSAAYRMRSWTEPADASNSAVDPDNRLVWRMNPRRLEAEIIRDSVHFVANRLDLVMGGPELDHNAALTTFRRSVYYRHAAEKQAPFLAIFDTASVNECYRRGESVAPQQALAMANSSMTLANARLLAGTLANKSQTRANQDDKSERAFVTSAFETLLGRMPASNELTECLNFLLAQATLLAHPERLAGFGVGGKSPVAPSNDPRQRARENLVHVLMNHTDFVTAR